MPNTTATGIATIHHVAPDTEPFPMSTLWTPSSTKRLGRCRTPFTRYCPIISLFFSFCPSAIYHSQIFLSEKLKNLSVCCPLSLSVVCLVHDDGECLYFYFHFHFHRVTVPNFLCQSDSGRTLCVIVLFFDGWLFPLLLLFSIWRRWYSQAMIGGW